MNPTAPAPAPPAAPENREAVRLPGANGAVQKGSVLTDPQAVARRTGGDDVVVCGTASSMANAGQALGIERTVGPCRHHARHPRRGPLSLPHYQQQAQQNQPQHPGHTFYEQPPTYMAV